MKSDLTTLKTKTDSLFGSWKKDGNFVPLFMKLQDLNRSEKEEDPPLKLLTKEDLRASVIAEISNLLNTRIKVSSDVFDLLIQNDDFKGYPDLYGLPDFSCFDVTNQATWNHYTFLIKTAILRYEPRLKNVSVFLERFTPTSQTLQASITGDLLIREMTEPLSFIVSLTTSKL